MKRVCAVALFALIAVLPAIDAVYCPDGCTDADRDAPSCQANASGAHGDCGLCVNAVAVQFAIPRVAPLSHPIAIEKPSPTMIVKIAPRLVDRPPRAQ
jgi:hypothetical protein